jgi:hypothetical protein
MIHASSKCALLLGICVLISEPAAAQWAADIKRDDFGSDHTGVAAVVSDLRFLALRCENKKVPMLIFGTRQIWGPGLGALPAQLWIRIDTSEPISRPAALEEYPITVGLTQQSGVRVVTGGDDLFPVLESIAGARTRVAIAVEIAGQRFENTRFSVRQSREAFQRIWPYCGSALGTDKKPSLD